MNNKIIKNAILNAGAATLYIALVASFLFYASHIFGQNGPDKLVLIPIAMLLLFVLSAAITGSLIFGRPVIWYLAGQKREALSLFIYTLGFLLVIMALMFLALYIILS